MNCQLTLDITKLYGIEVMFFVSVFCEKHDFDRVYSVIYNQVVVCLTQTNRLDGSLSLQ